MRNAIAFLQRQGPRTPELQWANDLLDRQVQHLTGLVDDLLDLSRVRHGKIALRKEVVELSAVVARAVETSRPLLESRRQHLTVAVPQEPLRVEADPGRLDQVVGNLLGNAAKYTCEEGRIWLSVERDGGEAVLRVRDTGVGIPAELLPRLFELFMQGPRPQGGLGIGLRLVKQLVELHGGNVQAFSDGPGRGSEFVVRLPALVREEPATAEQLLDAV
jgi:signal transduction histidine kinase